MPHRRFHGPAPKLNLPKEQRPRLWTVPDLARILGCTQQRIRALVKGKRIPCIRVGRTILFQPSDLQDFELRKARGPKPSGYTHAMRAKRKAEAEKPPEPG